MNILRNQLTYVPIFNKTLIQFIRNCTKYPELPKVWTMPQKISSVEPQKSGDGGINFNITKHDFIPNYDKCEELISIDEDFKKLFTIEFQRKKELVNAQRNEALQLVQRHKLDRGSMESRIAAATIEILRLQEHYKKLPKDKKSKVFLKELIEKRKKWLKKLRNIDYPRFEFLLERLNLVYHPFIEKDVRLTQKNSIRQLHEKNCHQIIQKKLDAYKSELKAKQKSFFTMKAEKLAFIRKEEISCGVKPTISEQQIKDAEAKAATFS